MTNFETQIQKLNPAQRKAVETLYGPVMVVAGPGTGKTQILALRIANILKKTDTDAENILCLTFTEAGASAMRERLISFIGNQAYKVSIHTFHSFCNEIIQAFPEKFSFSKDLRQLDELNKLKLLREVIDETEGIDKLRPFHDRYGRIRDIVMAIQTLKKESITPEELRMRIKALREDHENNPQERGGKPTKKWEKKFEVFDMLEELYKVYEAYQDLLQKKGYYDYEDMIMFVIDKFKVDDELLAHYQERFLYILVDEYQDTNGSQNEIIKLLGSFDVTPNIFVVGDDDQAIYRFQGANIGNILFFGKHFSEITMIPTVENYRSTQMILDIASSLIENNKTRLVNEYKDLEKKLKAFKTQASHKAEVWEFNNNAEENIFIAKEIQKLHEKGVDYNEIAILYRKNNHAIDIAEALNKFDVPSKIETTKSVFESEIVDQLINLLKVIYLYDKNANELLYKVMLYDFLNINTSDIYRLSRFCSAKRKDIFDVLDEEEILDEIKVKDKQKLIDFKNRIFEWHKVNANVPFPKFIERVLTESGLLDYVTKKGDTEIPKQVRDDISEVSDNRQPTADDKDFDDVLAINAFFDFITSQYQVDRDLKLAKFINDLDLIKDNNIKVALPKINSNKDSVNLLTVHSSKGLEFDYVFIVKATDNNWGKNRGSRNLLPKEIVSEIENIDESVDLSLEDERRLFFVAITRAREKIYFTFANEYITEGVSTAGTISRFITEVDQKLLDYKSVKNGDVKYELSEYIINLKPTTNSEFDEDEKEFLLEQIANFKLSPSALCDYLDSPEEFKINRLIRVPKAKSKEQALGTSIHYAFERFNKDFKNESFMSLDNFLKNYEEYLVKEFYGDEEFDRTMIEGKKILTGYYDTYIKTGEYKKALELEYSFYHHNIYLDANNGSVPIPLTGRIDKIEAIDSDGKVDADGTIHVRIIDYKTMRPKSENEIKGLTKNSKGHEWRQLIFYKLLTQLDSQFRPNQALNKPKYQICEASIDFLKSDASKKLKRVTFDITKEDIEELKSLIVEVMKRIRNLEFPKDCDLL